MSCLEAGAARTLENDAEARTAAEIKNLANILTRFEYFQSSEIALNTYEPSGDDWQSVTTIRCGDIRNDKSVQTAGYSTAIGERSKNLQSISQEIYLKLFYMTSKKTSGVLIIRHNR